MEIRRLQEGVIQIRGALVSSYLLYRDGEAALIDGGFIGGVAHVEAALAQAGLGWSALKAVLVTHGHLDHCLNLRAIAERSGASVYLHPADWEHLAGRYPYRGLARLCGWLEKAGRALFRYRPLETAEPLADEQRLNCLGGIRALSTPGHTAGHCAFLWEPEGLLFVGDLFACWWARTTFPWPFLNTCPERFPGSLDRIRALPAKGFLANHCDKAGAELQMRRFRTWHRRCGTSFDHSGTVL